MSTTDDRRAAAQAYIDACRRRIPAFVGRHFSIKGTLALHRGAIGGDLWRAPLNTLLAVPAFLVLVTALALRAVGAKSVAARLQRLPLGATTAVQRRVEQLILTELLALPVAIRATLTEESPLARLLRRYARTRNAATELTLNVLMLCIGFLVFDRLTPGSLSTGTVLAEALAEQSAIDAFPLGTWAGELYYSLFPPSWTLMDVGLAVVVTLSVVALLSSFVGVLTDPVQAALGIHRRRLGRLVDAIERRLVAEGPDYHPKDPYFARLVDLVDAARAAGTLLP